MASAERPAPPPLLLAALLLAALSDDTMKSDDTMNRSLIGCRCHTLLEPPSRPFFTETADTADRSVA